GRSPFQADSISTLDAPLSVKNRKISDAKKSLALFIGLLHSCINATGSGVDSLITVSPQIHQGARYVRK
ncbi:hypothetical protein, partial [Pseudomonas syringae]|uniref:hypothetical protein n=1 Tax=Pseudomonas syringae TaxID=317 RepID=UPI001F0786C8